MIELGHYVAVYGGDALFNPAFPTVDHIVPERLFRLLVGALPRVMGFLRLHWAQAAMSARAVAHSPDRWKAEEVMEQLIEDGLPGTWADAEQDAPVYFGTRDA